MASVIWKVPAPTKAVQFSAEQLKKDIIRIARNKLGLDPQEISSGMMDEWDEILTVYYNAGDYYGKDNIVSLVVDGKRQFYEVDPDVYRVIEGLDQYSLPWFLANFWTPGQGPGLGIGTTARMVRLGATGLNARFALIRNAIRDAWTFSVLGEHAKGGPVSAVGGIVKDVARTEAARHFAAMGGKMSSQILQDRIATQRLRAEMHEPFVVRTVLHPIDATREVFGITEAGPRIAEFEAALKKGNEIYGERSLGAALYALNAAQDVTTNFTRHGRIGKVLNQMIPFFNAAIQGPDKIQRCLLLLCGGGTRTRNGIGGCPTMRRPITSTSAFHSHTRLFVCPYPSSWATSSRAFQSPPWTPSIAKSRGRSKICCTKPPRGPIRRTGPL
jgi:hypothetical protein